LELPSDKFFIAALIIPIFLFLPKFLLLDYPENMSTADMVKGVVPLIISFFSVFFIIAFILRFISKFFGRIITYRKAINLIGYCQMPRVIFVVLFSMAAFFYPPMNAPGQFKEFIDYITIILSIYSLGLIIYGVKLAKASKDRENN
jgi:hypothetical protein